MAPRRIALSLLLALAVPALVPGAGAVVCDPEPDCIVGAAAEAAAPALGYAEQAYGVAAPWVAMGERYAGMLADPLLPDSTESIVLAGTGTATVRLSSGTQGTCGGEPRFMLEASEKTLGLEPTVTMSYAGAQGDGSLMFSCAQGEQRQPVEADIHGDFAGAWYAIKTFPSYEWRIDVSAPQPDGTRVVHYVYEHDNGTVHAFDGVLAEYR